MNLFCAIYGNGFLRFLLPAHRRKPEKYEITEKEKKTMKKKLFSMFLALAMIVSVFPVGGFAAEVQEEEKTLDFDDAAYLKESKNKMWVNIDDPNIVSSKTVSLDREIEIICRVDNFKKVYKPYREPEEILMNDFECSAEEAAQIMNGTSDDARVKYISTGLDFANYSISLEGPEIFVLQNDIVLTNLQYVAAGRPLTILAAKPYVVSMELAEGATLRPKQINAGICFGNFEEGGPIGSGAKITFSNVILDGKNKFIPLGIIASSVSDPVSLETPVLVEGACVINGKTSAATAAIESYGSVSYLGCTTVSNSTGIYGLFTGDVIVKDCNFYGLNTQREAFSAGGIGDATTFEVSNSFFVGGLGMGDIDPTSGKRGIDSLTIENCVMNRNSTLIAADISVKDSLVRWQDFSRFVPKGYWYWEYHYGKKHPGFLEIGGYSFASVDNVTFNSSSLLVYADSNPVKLGNADITNCDFVWNLPISEEERNEEGRGNLPAGITVFTFATSDHTITVDNADISGFIRGVSFWSHVTVKNSNIHGNEYGLWDASEYKSGIENSAKVSNSQIHDNLIAGICANSAEIFVSDSTITDNGSMDQANSGGLVFNLSEEPEGWDEFDEEYSGDYNVPRGIDVKNSTFKGNMSSTDGGAIRIEDSSISVSVTGTEFRDNTAAGAGGAISLSDYSKLTVDNQTVFQENMSQAAYYPPENAGTLYPNIQFDSTSVCSHPLNNYDINYVGSEETEVRVIASAPELEEVKVRYGTPVDEMLEELKKSCSTTNVVFDHSRPDDNQIIFPVNWRAVGSSYDEMARGTYLVYGEINLSENSGMENPRQILAKVWVTVGPDPRKIIQSVDPQTIEVLQNIYLAPVEKENGFGRPTVVSPPPTATVRLPKEDQTVDIPVRWDTKDFDPAVPGEQTIFGELLCEGEYREYTNPEKYQAKLRVSVLPREYILWQAAPVETSISLLPGAELVEINRQLALEKKNELAVDAFDMTTDLEVWTFCGFSLKKEDNPQWEQQKDIPGTYDLTASLPENFFPLSEEEPGPITVHVTVREPLEIIAVKDEEVEEYQSVDPAHFDHLPRQVIATLEDGQKVSVDVEWDWSGYQKNTASDQTVIGRLVNLPSKAKQPEGKHFTGKLIVHVIPVEYKITERLTDNFYEPSAALTLAEITALEELDQTFEITSITEGIDLATEYTAPVILEEAKNPDFDPKLADAYVLLGTVELPGNIHSESYPTYEEILLDTQPVDVISLEKKIIFAREGTAFADIPNKPETLIATLDVASPLTGEQKTEIVSVDWGNGEGYDPYPLSSENNGPVTESITGTVVNKQQYLGQVKEPPVLEIKVAREYDIESVSPARIPETGAMDVNLGSSLEDIYTQLETHTVQLNLRSTSGELITEEASFLLRAEDNMEYDPLKLGEQTLKGFLCVNDPIKNPNGLFVLIVVNTRKYTITTTKVARVTGVVSGTEFEAIPMPEEVEVARSDGAAEQVAVASWDGSKYNPTKIGTQVISGTLISPLPPHLENPDNRQPKAFVTVVNPTVKILSMEQVLEEPVGIRKSRAKAEEVPDYVEYRYKVKLRHEDGTTAEEIISMYLEEK